MKVSDAYLECIEQMCGVRPLRWILGVAESEEGKYIVDKKDGMWSGSLHRGIETVHMDWFDEPEKAIAYCEMKHMSHVTCYILRNTYYKGKEH